MSVLRVIIVGISFFVLGMILIVILDIAFTSFGLPLGPPVEAFLQFVIVYFGVLKFGVRKKQAKHKGVPK